MTQLDEAANLLLRALKEYISVGGRSQWKCGDCLALLDNEAFTPDMLAYDILAAIDHREGCAVQRILDWLAVYGVDDLLSALRDEYAKRLADKYGPE